MTSALDQLKTMTTVVADTGDARAIKTYRPVDCTTNPSLVLAALQGSASEKLVTREIELCRKADKGPKDVAATLTVAVGAELTKLVPGRVSTEVDPCLSFDSAASVQRARDIIADYGERGVSADRVLIKLAATWEGVRAAEILQSEGIDCNLTLLFSMPQAIACADAGVFLISPFVGRITDWYKKAEGKTTYAPDDDPGVRSVRTIYNYYKANGIRTIVMGASFRNLDQIKALAGCDRLTISPSLLDALEADTAHLPRKLSADQCNAGGEISMDEATFRWEMNADAMGTENLADGIRKFDADHRALIAMIAARMKA